MFSSADKISISSSLQYQPFLVSCNILQNSFTFHKRLNVDSSILKSSF